MSKDVDYSFGNMQMECDNCGYSIDIDTTDFRTANDYAKEQGWIIKKIGEEWYDFCEEGCLEKFNNPKLSEDKKEVEKVSEVLDKITIFQKELGYIKDESVRKLVEKALLKVNDKFFTAPAASSGKYHPQFAQGDGGLVRHTKAAIWFAKQLLDLECTEFKNGFTKDFNSSIIIAALLLHDTCKSGLKWEGDYTKHEHPLLVEKLLEGEKLSESDKLHWGFINKVIISHMGQWSSSNNSSIVLPKPESQAQIFAHYCDFLASRKELDLKMFNK